MRTNKSFIFNQKFLNDKDRFFFFEHKNKFYTIVKKNLNIIDFFFEYLKKRNVFFSGYQRRTFGFLIKKFGFTKNNFFTINDKRHFFLIGNEIEKRKLYSKKKNYEMKQKIFLNFRNTFEFKRKKFFKMHKALSHIRKKFSNIVVNNENFFFGVTDKERNKLIAFNMFKNVRKNLYFIRSFFKYFYKKESFFFFKFFYNKLIIKNKQSQSFFFKDYESFFNSLSFNSFSFDNFLVNKSNYNTYSYYLNYNQQKQVFPVFYRSFLFKIKFFFRFKLDDFGYFFYWFFFYFKIT